jgi:integrase
MASIYKRKCDRGLRHSTYWIQYTDHNGRRRTVKGLTDKALTTQIAAKLENEVVMRKSGLLGPEQERLADHRRASVADHLAAFERSLANNTPRYVRLTMGRVRRIIEGCGFAKLSDIDVEVVDAHLKQIQTKKKVGPRTYNHYAQAIHAFGNWLVATNRLVRNPVIGLERLNAEVDVRHRRRALKLEEITKLVESARNSGVDVQCYTGEQRARIYVMSYMTGLRRQELASLTPQSFDFATNPPILTLQAVNSKHRKRDVLPLHPALVTMLREWLKGMAPDQKLFPNLERKKTWSW